MSEKIFQMSFVLRNLSGGLYFTCKCRQKKKVTCCFLIIPGSQGKEQADVGGNVELLFQTRISEFSFKEPNHFPTTYKN